MIDISSIRQMMADSKFFDAMKALEVALIEKTSADRRELLLLYLEALSLQDFKLPEVFVLEAAEVEFDHDVEESSRWLGKLSPQFAEGQFVRVQLLKIKIAESRGLLQELYNLISSFKLWLFEKKLPIHVELIEATIQKFFKNDFHLKLQDLGLRLLLGDLDVAEKNVQELIYSCIEKASPKGTKEKLLAVAEIIHTHKEKKQLEIYQAYCRIAAAGISDKSDYKKLAEMMIYFEDYKLQVLLLDLLHKLGLEYIAMDYSVQVRANKDYSFIYFEKYFSDLKGYFVSRPQKPAEEKKPIVVDLTLEKPLSPLETVSDEFEDSHDEEVLLISTLRVQDLEFEDLMELATSFIQSGFYKAALEASKTAMSVSETDSKFLKSAYVQAICLCQLRDFRSVIDLAMQGLERAESQIDILSFLYLEAEAFQKLGQIKAAKRTLQKIISIDPHYRLSRERLERLNEV